MHSALIVVVMPEAPFNADVNPVWQTFLVGANPASQQAGVEQLAENVWLVNFQKNPAALAQLIQSAEKLKLVYKILPLESAPLWLPVAADPKPT